MFKEIVIIITILIIIFSTHFITINYLKETTDKLIIKIDEINNFIKDDIELAKQNTDDLENEWQNIYKVLSVIVMHQELDQIELSIISAKIAINNEDIDEALIELGKLKFLLEHINDRESFKLKNVF